jgi:outer membrane protein assembly factor BamD
MAIRHILILILILLLNSCSNKDSPVYKPSEKVDAFLVYNEGLEAFKKNDYFFARKKFDIAELNFNSIDLAAKSALMSSYSLYAINFYDEAIINLERFIKKYPADENIIYANYLICIVYFEQISDEKKDLEPLIKAKNKILLFIKKFPETEYAFDLKFKMDLIESQLAAKELYVANYYIKTQKWASAIKRLKNILANYDKTVFIEEALFRLVEIYYHLGIEEEATKYASALGYNYNSSEWHEMSYKLLNKDYEVIKKNPKDKEKQFLDKILGLIK